MFTKRENHQSYWSKQISRVFELLAVVRSSVNQLSSRPLVCNKRARLLLSTSYYYFHYHHSSPQTDRVGHLKVCVSLVSTYVFIPDITNIFYF